MKIKKLVAIFAVAGTFAVMGFAQTLDMVKIPGLDIEMLKTEVTQEL